MSESKTAQRIKNLPGFRGEACLYKCAPPLEGHEYVVVSAAFAMFDGPETYIFPADKDGEVIDWGELSGSLRGTLEHEDALQAAGYAIEA